MELTSHILLTLFIILTINSGIKYPLEKLTMYKKSDITNQSTWFVILFAFFGVFMLLLYKPIRQYRKEYYIKNKIRMYEFWILQHQIYPPGEVNYGKVWPHHAEQNDKYYEEYLNNKRYLKLITIQRKSKRNVLLGKFGI